MFRILLHRKCDLEFKQELLVADSKTVVKKTGALARAKLPKYSFFNISLFSRYTVIFTLELYWYCYFGIGIFRCRDLIPGPLGHGSNVDALVRTATMTPHKYSFKILAWA